MPMTAHNFRMDADLMAALRQRADEIADLGIPGDRNPQFRFNVTDIFHRELDRVRHETLEQTLQRYGIADPRAAAR